MFGETVTNDAIKEYAKSIGVQRDKGNLSVDSAGRLNTSNEGNKIRKMFMYKNHDFLIDNKLLEEKEMLAKMFDNT